MMQAAACVIARVGGKAPVYVLILWLCPSQRPGEMAVLEPIIRHSIFEIASPLIQEHIERMMSEQAEITKQSLPDALRAHVRSMEEDVREQLKRAATEQVERLAPDAIRAVAEEQIQTTVQNVIPSLVEEHIKAEIRRLTQAA